MSETKELTYKDVEPHNSKKVVPGAIFQGICFIGLTSTKDLYLVIHDKVYNTSSFVDEHPGGEEVLLDVGGQDATEAFEDVGHSDEAREILDGLLVGNLKRVAGDPEPKSTPSLATTTTSKDSAGMGVGLYATVLVGVVIALGAYQYLQVSAKDGK